MRLNQSYEFAETMTVGELVTILQQIPPELELWKLRDWGAEPSLRMVAEVLPIYLNDWPDEALRWERNPATDPGRTVRMKCVACVKQRNAG